MGLSFSRLLQSMQSAPGLQILSEFPSPTAMPDAIRLVKMRTDYFEFIVYTPIGANGIDWARHFMTNRLNAENTGVARLIRSTPATLNASNVVAPNAVNVSTGTQGKAPDVSVGTAGAASRTGTWTASGTVGGEGVTDQRYSTTPGDYVEYTMTGVTRIVLRQYGNISVGGIAVISIKTGGNEIADGLFLTRPGKLVDGTKATGFLFSPLAEGLTPASTYTVRITVDASNPGGGRVYEGGLVGYNGIEFDAVGVHGTCETRQLASPVVNTSAFLVVGSVTVYEVTEATQVNWRAVTNEASGEVDFTVYDDAGVEIDAGDYTRTTFDTYRVSSLLQTIEVASGLTKGTYYLHVKLLNTKNAASTDYRMHDYGALGLDETAAGNPATDLFNDYGAVPDGISLALLTLQGQGNVEHAMSIRKPVDDPGVRQDFAGGIHGNERAPTDVVVKVGGVVIDYAAGAVADVWNGDSLEITFNTILEFPESSDAFATLNHRLLFDRTGYRHDLTRTMTADAMVLYEYMLMAQAPKTANPATQEGGYGGALTDAVVFPGGEVLSAVNDDDESLYAEGEITDVVLYNAAKLVHESLLNRDEVVAAFAGIAGTAGVSFLHDRSDPATKFYLTPRTFTPTTGSLIPAGHTYTARRLMRLALR